MTDEEIIIQLRDKIELWDKVFSAEDGLYRADESLICGESYDFYHGNNEARVHYAESVLKEVEKYLTKELKAEIRKAAEQFKD